MTSNHGPLSVNALLNSVVNTKTKFNIIIIIMSLFPHKLKNTYLMSQYLSKKYIYLSYLPLKYAQIAKLYLKIRRLT